MIISSLWRVNGCSKALIHETMHVEWTLFLLFMHLITSFLNMVPQNTVHLGRRERLLLLLLELRPVMHLPLFNWLFALRRKPWSSGLLLGQKRLLSYQLYGLGRHWWIPRFGILLSKERAFICLCAVAASWWKVEFQTLLGSLLENMWESKDLNLRCFSLCHSQWIHRSSPQLVPSPIIFRLNL